MIDINKEIIEAREGLEIWERINRKYLICNSDCVICFPTSNNELNEVALSHVQRYAAGKYFSRAILLSVEEVFSIEKTPKGLAKIEKEYLSQDEMTSLIRLARIMNIGNRMIVVSAVDPFGNLNLIGKYGIDLEDYVTGTYL